MGEGYVRSDPRWQQDAFPPFMHEPLMSMAANMTVTSWNSGPIYAGRWVEIERWVAIERFLLSASS